MKITKFLTLLLFTVLILASCADNSDVFNEIFSEQSSDDEGTDDTDTDNDGVSDDDETADGTDPNKPDTDGDGVIDGTEKSDSTNPLDICSFVLESQTLDSSQEWKDGDCDSDGVTNKDEVDAESDTLKADTDGDGVNDGDEVRDETDALDNCSLLLESQNLTPDSTWNSADCDSDGITNAVEIQDGTDIFQEDSDSDGANDGQEKSDGTDPLKPDTDGDGVTDGKENTDTTDPNDFCSLFINSQTLESSTEWKNADCDSDGISNIDEINNGTDPLTPEQGEVSAIVGIWSLTDATISNGQASTLFEGQTVSFAYSSTSENENASVTFTENPNELTGMGEYTNVINFSLFGNDYSDVTVVPSPLNNGNWQIINDDDELLVSGDENSNGSYRIIELTDTSMVLEKDIDQPIFAGGVNLDVTGTLTLTFSR
ncbi:hypothetical protein [Costertonia aggregata]|uniref:Lipocalin family protein n=1 Tax=Costertonia aggregata TaxID=343403 RepID=A0A7H9ASI6_9FLAO|nr:hypothetical protein [Costertonia aggregata]QLG46409.1 hypothetical protein HYG79_13975 [Costertonia aggregata]